eukprot:7916442-Lingulodinium_polyedra.AAC.1
MQLRRAGSAIAAAAACKWSRSPMQVLQVARVLVPLQFTATANAIATTPTCTIISAVASAAQEQAQH